MAKTIPQHRHQDSRKQWTTQSPPDPAVYATSADILALQDQIDELSPQGISSTDLKRLRDDVDFLMGIVCPPKRRTA